MTSKAMFPGQPIQPKGPPPQHLVGPYSKVDEKQPTQPKGPPPQHLVSPYSKVDEKQGGENRKVKKQVDEDKVAEKTKKEQGAAEVAAVTAMVWVAPDCEYDLSLVSNEQLHEELATRLGLRSKPQPLATTEDWKSAMAAVAAMKASAVPATASAVPATASAGAKPQIIYIYIYIYVTHI